MHPRTARTLSMLLATYFEKPYIHNRAATQIATLPTPDRDNVAQILTEYYGPHPEKHAYITGIVLTILQDPNTLP